MAAIFNDSALPHFAFSNMDAAGREFGVLMLKAAFDIAEDGECTLSADQEPFAFTDRCHGAHNLSSLRQPSDLVSFKPEADVVVDAIAYAPGGVAARTWHAGIKVLSGATSLAIKQLRVTGPRRWDPVWRGSADGGETHDRHRSASFEGWRLSEPTEVESVPIRYELAFGGSLPTGKNRDGREIVEVDERNPIGCGWIDRALTDRSQAVAAPQIEAVGEPIEDPFRPYEPAGFGPIPPAWLPRRPLAGTYDQHWIDNVWPRWPADYHFAYNNSAPAGLRLGPFPQGPLEIMLLNLRPRQAEFVLRLPDLRPVFIRDEGSRLDVFRPNLDTLTLSVAAEALFDCRVTVVWRAPFDLATTQAIAIDVPDEAERLRIQRENEPVADAPHPAACARPCDLLEGIS